jgi:hypothetical protein
VPKDTDDTFIKKGNLTFEKFRVSSAFPTTDGVVRIKIKGKK